MALLLKLPIHHPPSLPNSTHQRPKNASFRPNYVKFRSIPTIVNITTPMCRRSANWQPSIWDFKFIQSLSSDYEDDVHVRRAEKLKEKVRKLFNAEDMTSFELLELVDTSQRLGISYHFDKEIKNSLETVVMHSNFGTKEGLYATSLLFRLLRQHGYPISQDVFLGFKDDSGKFDVSLSKDIKGLLNLYEASYLAVEGEIIMDEARAFASKHLNNIVKSKTPIPHKLAKQVSYSLELPLHLRMLRLDARWYIEGGFIDVNSDLLEFAKLDFNMVQATHQNDLREVSKWWRDIGLGSHPELRFARDRLMECFLWTIGVNFNPEFRNTRRGLTKINALITTIDDVYDIYGSLEELELFTDVIERWDINAIEELPYYMKLCFTTLYNTVNEMAYITLKEQGLDIRHQLRHKWADLCKAYLVEAKWYDRKYTPTLEEYLNNGYISITGPVILVHVHFLANQEITEAALQCIQGYPDIIRWSSMIVRLCDDLGTSSGEMERGDVPKSIQCYMNETGCSEELAREHIKHLIVETWTKMNKERVDDSIFPHRFREEAVNLARMAQCMYLYGDGHGVPDQETKERVIALLVEPIVI